MPTTQQDDAKKESPKDDVAKRAALLQQQARDLITDTFGEEWWTAWPPDFLFESAGVNETLKDAITLTKPHWEGTAAMIGSDGRGYRLALDLLDRLQTHLASLEARDSSADDPPVLRMRNEGPAWEKDSAVASDTLFLEQAILREGYGLGGFETGVWESLRRFEEPKRVDHEDGYGPEKTLGDSLGMPKLKDGANDRSEKWKWVLTTADGSDPHRYTLIPLDEDGEPKYALIEELSGIPATTTWAEALQVVTSLGAKVRSRMYSKPAEMLAFRRDVVADVIRLFEVTGSVGSLEECIPSRDVPLSDNDEIIARTAFEVLTEDGARFTSKSGVVGATVDRLGENGYPWKHTRVRTALANANAYQESGPRGGATADTTGLELKRLKRQLHLRYGR